VLRKDSCIDANGIHKQLKLKITCQFQQDIDLFDGLEERKKEKEGEA
jgi:hypothetical protein